MHFAITVGNQGPSPEAHHVVGAHLLPRVVASCLAAVANDVADPRGSHAPPDSTELGTRDRCSGRLLLHSDRLGAYLPAVPAQGHGSRRVGADLVSRER